MRILEIIIDAFRGEKREKERKIGSIQCEVVKNWPNELEKFYLDVTWILEKAKALGRKDIYYLYYLRELAKFEKDQSKKIIKYNLVKIEKYAYSLKKKLYDKARKKTSHDSILSDYLLLICALVDQVPISANEENLKLPISELMELSDLLIRKTDQVVQIDKFPEDLEKKLQKNISIKENEYTIKKENYRHLIQACEKWVNETEKNQQAMKKNRRITVVYRNSYQSRRLQRNYRMRCENT